MERLELGSATIAYVEVGAGRPVLLIHGWAGDHRGIMAAAEPGFAEAGGHWRRIYVDLPGMGESPRLAPGANAADLVDLLGRVATELAGEGPTGIVGFSYGGYLAHGLVRSNPDRVSGLALIAPVMQADLASRSLPDPIKLSRAPDEAFTDPVVAEFRPLIIDERTEVLDGITRHFTPGFMAADHGYLDEFQATGYALPDEGLALREPFSKPSLIVTGRQDGLVGFVSAHGLHGEYPRATIATLDGAGHALIFERADTLRALFTDWLRRLEQQWGWPEPTS